MLTNLLYDHSSLCADERKALNVLLTTLPRYTEVLLDRNMDFSKFPDNFRAFSVFYPNVQEHWQSQCNRSVIRVGNATVCMQKFTSVRHHNKILWLCEVYLNDFMLYFLWCEKGEICMSGSVPLGSPTPITLDDLSFLRPFVSTTLAIDLGWEEKAEAAS